MKQSESTGATGAIESTFTLYPAIDIRDGQCVRLLKGDYNQETVYGHPVDMAQKWVEQGAQWLHLVDLDGAKEGSPSNEAIIQKIAEEVPVPVQVGGGIRNLQHMELYLQAGVERLILGTSAIKDPAFVQEALRHFSSHVAIGLDARDGYVATEGWLQSSQVRVEEAALRLADQGAQTFIFTDIGKDGTLAGPNVEATVQLAQAVGQEVIASGGIRAVDDIRHLFQLRTEGIAGVIIGKALYQDKFTLTEALEVVQ